MGWLVSACNPRTSSERDNASRRLQQPKLALRGWDDELVSPSTHSLPSGKGELPPRVKVKLHLKTLAFLIWNLQAPWRMEERTPRSRIILEVEKFLKCPDLSQGFRWAGSIAVEEDGAGGAAQAGPGSLGGQRGSFPALEHVPSPSESCKRSEG